MVISAMIGVFVAVMGGILLVMTAIGTESKFAVMLLLKVYPTLEAAQGYCEDCGCPLLIIPEVYKYDTTTGTPVRRYKVACVYHYLTYSTYKTKEEAKNHG